MTTIMTFSMRKILLQSYSRVPLVNVNHAVNLQLPLTPTNSINSRTYAAEDKKGGSSKAAATGSRRKEFPVEKDPYKLQEYCCGSNIYIEGEDVKLKPESEYPDWLWELRTGPPPTLEELEPNSKEYWLKVRELNQARTARLWSLKTKVLRKW